MTQQPTFKRDRKGRLVRADSVLLAQMRASVDKALRARLRFEG